MKKVPSYPKITTKTNITVNHTQNININSPKAVMIKKGFKSEKVEKSEQVKIKETYIGAKKTNQVVVGKSQSKKSIQPIRRSSKKQIKQQKQTVVNQKSIKDCKSQRELAMLSEKLKRLEQKINKIREKQKVQKVSSASHRSFSKNSESAVNFMKKQASSSRKQIGQKVYHLTRVQSDKILKKSSASQKQAFQSSAISKYKKKSQSQKSRQKQFTQPKQKKKHDQQILHQIVTQIPNNHPPGFQKSLQKSLPKNKCALTPSSESEDQQPEQYYVSKAIKSLSKPTLLSIREHLTTSLSTMQYLHSNIKKPILRELQKKTFHLPASKFEHTIILDLDETLIHCNETMQLPFDVKLAIRFPTGQKIDAGVNIRPHAKHFLHELSKICEVIVFTASHQCYANVVLDHLDPKKQYISHRLFREHCWQTEEGVYIKDLRVLKNRNLQNLILVDNAAYSYFFQLQNGVPIIPFYDDKSDNQLLILLQYIKSALKNSQKMKNSLKQYNHNYFKLTDYLKYENIHPLVQSLYSATDSSSQQNA